MVPDVGFVITAENWVLLIESTRISCVEATRIRSDEGDHRNQFIEAESSEGREMTREMSRERVSLMLSLEGKMVAMFAPFGLGREWVDAIHC